MLTQYHITLPPRLAEQLKWSRFINTHGTIAHNINNVPAESGAHSKKSIEKDLHKVVNQLVKSRVFNVLPSRKHKSFPNIKTNYIRTLSEQDLKDWMIMHYANVLLE